MRSSNATKMMLCASTSRSQARSLATRTSRLLWTRPRDLFSTLALDEAARPPLPPMPSTSQPLGAPMPVDEHACSVSLPTWASVVGYEEGNPAVVQALQVGYPRFVYHPYVLQLMKHIMAQHGNGKEDCLVLPSIYAARRCQLFLQRALYGDDLEREVPVRDPAFVGRQTEAEVAADATQASQASRIRVVSVNAGNSAAVHAVVFPATTAAGSQAKAYWQHTGEVVSSRRAQACFQDLGIPLTQTVTEDQHICHEAEMSECDPATTLRQSLAVWAGTSPDDIVLTPSGMAAVYLALQSARRRHQELHPNQQGGKAIVYGFPYLDTLKLCSRNELCPDGVEFFGRADTRDLAALEAFLEANPTAVSVLMTEVPSNPLLHCPDVVRLRELADQYNFMLVVDDTIANFLNVNLLESGLADALVSSLTKLVSGRGDAMAGSVVCNPGTAGGKWMQQDLTVSCTEGASSGLYCPDALAIVRNSQDFPARNERINQTTEALADWLQQQDAVERVYYPKLSPSAPLYHQVQSGGYGGLMSIVLEPNMCQRTFYDALDVAKGPSLGTNFTLVCPYTLLAHYHELDFAMSYEVPPNLVRIAVGLEALEVLQEKFLKALAASRLYPKVCMDSVEERKSQQKREYSTTTSCGQAGSCRGTSPCACQACSHTGCSCHCNCGAVKVHQPMSLRGWTPSRWGSLALA